MNISVYYTPPFSTFLKEDIKSNFTIRKSLITRQKISNKLEVLSHAMPSTNDHNPKGL